MKAIASGPVACSVEGREVRVTHPHKAYFTREAKLSKLDIVRYFLSVAPGALAGIRDRPVVLKRFVDGAEGQPFYQKRAPDKRPQWLRTVTLSFPSGRTAEEAVDDDAAGRVIIDFHWSLGTLVNFPIGDYQDGEIANISFNRWATDVFATATWLDPALGVDLSGAAGVTFNGENPATNYETGTEFHIEWAASKMFSPQFNVGLTGYYYNQLTGDSGSGALLGDFEGEVAAIGGTVGYNFQLGILPVSTRLKYFHEFAVENRLEGDAGFLTVSMPLWVPQPPPPQ